MGDPMKSYVLKINRPDGSVRQYAYGSYSQARHEFGFHNSLKHSVKLVEVDEYNRETTLKASDL
jgi:hypothetical protein